MRGRNPGEISGIRDLTMAVALFSWNGIPMALRVREGAG